MKKSRPGAIALYLAAVIVFIAAAYYVTLPPMSIYSGAFWTFLFLVDAVIFVSYFVVNILAGTMFADSIRFPSGNIDFREGYRSGKRRVFLKIQSIVTLLAIAFIILGSIVSSEVFRAKTYSSLINVENADFATDIAETEYVSDIALMDSASARIIGARTLGTLSDLVSQYNVAGTYTQIAMADGEGGTAPYKVAPLEYASFFKWITNQASGIPGYVRVDPVKFDAEFVRLDKAGDGYIRYSPSAYFSYDLSRALRFAYPGAIFGSVYFEVDDSGHPYWIASVMKPNAGLFGAFDVESVVTLDACTGETARYKPAEAPEWIDIVYSGDLICQKYDWYGMLRGGYINSAFSQTDCVVTTNDFGYKIIGNDVYVFTGVTSTSNDEANIGFILANSRTGEYRYYSVPGAEEYSAMSAAEGSVQQYRYTASFPSLINVDGEATYIMVLKDASGIVKMYSMVNVRNYNIVVTSTTQDEVFRNYKAALSQSLGKTDADSSYSAKITVADIVYITQNGETTVYLKSDDGLVFGMPFDESVLFIGEGDVVTVYCYSEPDNADGTVIRAVRVEK